jgi:hypothetical protein
MNDKSLYDQELRARLGRLVDGVAPDSVMLAAWLEGRLDEANTIKVEAWLASNADTRRALIALRDAVPEQVPESELALLRALVPPKTGIRSPRPSRWREWLATWVPNPRVALAAVVLLALTGWLGLAAGERLAEAQWQRQAAAALPGGFLLDPGV